MQWQYRGSPQEPASTTIIDFLLKYMFAIGIWIIIVTVTSAMVPVARVVLFFGSMAGRVESSLVVVMLMMYTTVAS